MRVTIDIGAEFSKYPGGRYIKKGPYSGEEFRDKYLIPALEKAKDSGVEVILDTAIGYSSSFLEETFGGLVRSGFQAPELKKNLHLISDKTVLKDEIWEYIMSATKDCSQPLNT